MFGDLEKFTAVFKNSTVKSKFIDEMYHDCKIFDAAMLYTILLKITGIEDVNQARRKFD